MSKCPPVVAVETGHIVPNKRSRNKNCLAEKGRRPDQTNFDVTYTIIGANVGI